MTSSQKVWKNLFDSLDYLAFLYPSASPRTKKHTIYHINIFLNYQFYRRKNKQKRIKNDALFIIIKKMNDTSYQNKKR